MKDKITKIPTELDALIYYLAEIGKFVKWWPNLGGIDLILRLPRLNNLGILLE